MKLKKLSALAAMVLALSMLTVSAFAANIGSVESKTAPEISSATDANGNAITLEVTSVNDASSLSEEAADQLLAAVEQIKTSALTDLVSNLADKLAAVNANASVDNLVVRDLFDVSLPDGTEVDGPVTFTVKTSIAAGTTVLVLHNYQDSLWEVVDSTLNSDGSLTITTTHGLSPFAILVDTSTATTTSSGASSVTSPQTGESISGAAVIVSAAFIGLAGIFAVLSRKRENG